MPIIYSHIRKEFRLTIAAFLLMIPFCHFGQSIPDTVITVNYRFNQNSEAQRIQVEIRGDKAFLEDDILLGDATDFLNSNTNRAAILSGSNRRWPNNTIPYIIPDNFTQRQAVISAITHISSRTNLKFVVRTNEPNFVRFVSQEEGCFSALGMIGGEQRINMDEGCGFSAAIHEICHAAGMFHEQVRRDRDDYVTINWNNIIEGKKHNFQKYSVRGFQGTDFDIYDYNSIMHYGTNFFSLNGRNTIDIKSPPAPPGTTVGDKTKLSKIDILTLNSMYGLLSRGNENIVLSSELATNSNPICPRSPFVVDVSITNNESENVVGETQLFLHDRRNGTVITNLGEPLPFGFDEMNNNMLMKFTIDSVSAAEDKYLLALWIIDEEGNPGQLIGDGAYQNGKLIELTSGCDSTSKDQYEFNDTANDAYIFTVEKVDTSFIITTVGSNIHTQGDIDYYNLTLPPNQNYFVNARIFDLENDINEEDLDLDVIISKKALNDNWENYRDNGIVEQHILNGASTSYRVKPHFPGDEGSYVLELDIQVDPNPMLEFTRNMITVGSEDTLITVAIQSNRTWNISQDEDWVLSFQDTGFGYDTIKITIEKNDNFDSRESVFNINTESNEISRTFQLIQEGKQKILRGEVDVLPVCFNQGEAIVFIESNTEWSASSDNNWISIIEPRGAGNDFIIVDLTVNLSGSTRRGEIMLETDGVSNVIKIVQPTSQEFLGCVDPVYAEVGPNAGSIELELNTNLLWQVESPQDWITSVSPENGDTEGKIVIQYNAMPETENDTNRIARINFNLESLGPLHVIINQGNNFSTSAKDLPSLLASKPIIFPNPSKDKINIIFELKKSIALNASIYNYSGVLMEEIKLPPSFTGVNEYSINTKNYMPGLYFLTLHSSEVSFSKSFIIQR